MNEIITENDTYINYLLDSPNTTDRNSVIIDCQLTAFVFSGIIQRSLLKKMDIVEKQLVNMLIGLKIIILGRLKRILSQNGMLD